MSRYRSTFKSIRPSTILYATWFIDRIEFSFFPAAPAVLEWSESRTMNTTITRCSSARRRTVRRRSWSWHIPSEMIISSCHRSAAEPEPTARLSRARSSSPKLVSSSASTCVAVWSKRNAPMTRVPA